MTRVSLERFLPVDVCGRVVEKVILGLQRQSVKEAMATDRDRDYFFACLKSGLAIGQAQAVVAVYGQVFDCSISWQDEELNKYARIFFRDIVTIFEPTSRVSEDSINSALRLLAKLISGEGQTASRFTKETWGAALRCLLECAPKYKGNQPLNPLVRMFVDTFHLAELEIETGKELLRGFAKLCFEGRKYDEAAAWDELFRATFSMLLGSDPYEKKRLMAMLLEEMRKIGKEADENDRRQRNWTVTANYFKLALDTLRTEFRANAGTKLFKELLPGDVLMRLFADGCFLQKFRDLGHVLDHMKDVFKLFTQGGFAPNSQWIELFTKYICTLLQTDRGDRNGVTYAIVNHSANLAAEHPELMSSILDRVLAAASSLHTNIGHKDLEMVSRNQARWPNLLANILALARAEGRNDLVRRVRAVISKFTSEFFLVDGAEDLRIHVLMLNILSEDEKGVARLLLQLEHNIKESYKIRKGLVVNFSFLMLGLAPSYMPGFGMVLEESRAIERIANWLNESSSDSTHGISLAMSIIEISHKSMCLVKHRSFVPALMKYLDNVTKTSSNATLTRMAEYAKLAILSKPVCAKQCRSFEVRYTKKYVVAVNGMIVTFGESGEGDIVGATVRNVVGVSLHGIEARYTQKEPPSDDLMPTNCFTREELQIDGYPPFDSLKAESAAVRRSNVVAFLSDMSLFSRDPSCWPRLLRGGEDLLSELAELDEMNSVNYYIRIASIGRESSSFDDTQETQQSRRFQEDLGECFQMGMCSFRFQRSPEHTDDDILVVFNECGNKINGRHENPVTKYSYKLVVSVEPVYRGLSQDLLMYKVSVVKAFEAYLILPFVHKKPRIVPPESLAQTICSVLFVYKAQFTYDREAQLDKCTLAQDYIDFCAKRSERIVSIIERFALDDCNWALASNWSIDRCW